MPKGNAALSISVRYWTIDEDQSVTLALSIVGTVTDDRGNSVVMQNPVSVDVTIPPEKTEKLQGSKVPFLRRGDPRVAGKL